MNLKLISASLITIVFLVGCGAQKHTAIRNIEGDHPITASSWSGYCGKERATVKHTVDAAAKSIKTTPQSTTVDKLVALSVPSALSGPNTPRLPEESKVYRVTGTLTLVKHESDGDSHMVLQSSTGKTMILESIPASCAIGSPFITQITAVRKAVDSIEFNLPKKVTVTGVAFFDFKHGQTGVADNAIELHPLLSIK